MRPKCTVGNCILQNYCFLSKLAKTKSKKKQLKLLSQANPQQIASIVEIAYNICNFGFQLTPSKMQKLTPYATPIRKLSRARTAYSAKRVLQDGKGFPLASLLIPVLLAAGKTLLE